MPLPDPDGQHADAEHPYWVPVSPGELLDKLTILELKAVRLQQAAALRNVAREHAQLVRVVEDRALLGNPRVAALTQELRRVNALLWDVEAALRGCEARGEFGEGFVALARSVYRRNDERAALKRAINQLLGSPLCEEKDYAPRAGALSAC